MIALHGAVSAAHAASHAQKCSRFHPLSAYTGDMRTCAVAAAARKDLAEARRLAEDPAAALLAHRANSDPEAAKLLKQQQKEAKQAVREGGAPPQLPAGFAPQPFAGRTAIRATVVTESGNQEYLLECSLLAPMSQFVELEKAELDRIAKRKAAKDARAAGKPDTPAGSDGAASGSADTPTGSGSAPDASADASPPAAAPTDADAAAAEPVASADDAAAAPAASAGDLMEGDGDDASGDAASGDAAEEMPAPSGSRKRSSRTPPAAPTKAKAAKRSRR
jgi:hypothetical protein